MEQSLDGKMSVEPVGEIGPVQTERQIGAGEKRVLQRERKALHRVGGDDAAQDCGHQIQQPVGDGPQGFHHARLRGKAAHPVHHHGGGDEKNDVRQRGEDEFGGERGEKTGHSQSERQQQRCERNRTDAGLHHGAVVAARDRTKVHFNDAPRAGLELLLFF